MKVSRGRRGIALTAAVLFVLALGGFGAPAGRPTTGETEEECQAGSETYMPDRDESEPSNPHIVPLGGLVFEIALDPDFVYALHEVTVPVESSGPGPAYRSSSMAVSRVDRQTREVLRGDSLCFGFEMALTDSWLWVLDLEHEAESCHGVLYRFDPDTLRRADTVRLPPPPPLEPSAGDYSVATPDPPTPCDSSAMTSTPAGVLWVAVGRHLHRLGDDGAIEATVVTEAPALDLAADPTGRHLYSAEWDLYSAEEGRVVRRDSEVGVAEAAAEVGADSPDTLAATADGVWVVVRHHREAERRLVHFDTHLRETNRMERPVGHALAVGAQTLWTMTDDGLHCADAATGSPRAPGPQGPGASEVAADDDGVYLNTPDEARPDRSGVYIPEPDAACRW